MSRKELEHLRKKASHTLEEKKAKDEYNLAENQWQMMNEGGWSYNQEKIDAQASKCNDLRLTWCKIHDDNRDLNEGRFPAITHEGALGIIIKLTNIILENK